MKEKLRAVGTNQIGWKYAKEVISTDNLKDFSLLSNRRDLRTGNVKKLKRLLMAGTHFETPFVCNKKNGKYRLIDGNHRFEAITEFLEEYPSRRVEVGICHYEGLGDDEEKKMFTKWNLGTKQNTGDFVKQYWTEIPVTKKLQPPYFPCKISHSWSTGHLDLKMLLAPYLVKDSEGEKVAFQGSAMQFIENAKDLGEKDIRTLKQFMTEYIEVFGNPDRANPAYRTGTFMAVARIWYKNHTRFMPAAMKKRLAKLRGSERMIFWSGQGASRTALVQCLRDFLEIVNKGNRRESNRMV